METTQEERDQWAHPGVWASGPTAKQRINRLIRDVETLVEALRTLYELCKPEGDEDAKMEPDMWITVEVSGEVLAKARAVLG